MKVNFKPSFVRDFKKLPFDVQKEVRYISTEIFPKLRGLHDFQTHPTKPITGFRHYFRIQR